MSQTHHKIWTEDMDATLMQAMSEDVLMAEAGRRLGMTRDACIGRFGRIRKAMGYQAQ